MATPTRHSAGLTRQFVLDNPEACGGALDNQPPRYGEHTASVLPDQRTRVPALREPELTNLLRTACRRRCMNAQFAQAVIEHITSLPITVDRRAVRPGEVLRLARRRGAGLRRRRGVNRP